MPGPKLLFADNHLTDNPLEEYRWEFLDKTVPELIRKHKIEKIYCLGDTVDRKDRHSAVLVNRLVQTFQGLQNLCERVIVLKGNHDAPLEGGQAFWDFLNRMGIYYVDKPWIDDDILLLPYAHNPMKEWAENDYSQIKCILMHQPIDGAVVENGYKLQGCPRLPIFPRGIPIYSGDIHRPQTLGGVTYLGAPYPVRFGEDWDNRVLILNQDYKNPKDVPIPAIRRSILDIACIDDIPQGSLGRGDQVRIRVHLSAADLEQWPIVEEGVREQIAELGATLMSIEAVLAGSETTAETSQVSTNLEALSPADLVGIFAMEEKLSQDVLDAGLELLRKTQ